MNRISPQQFAALVLINDFFALICLGGEVSLMTMTGFILGILLQGILCIPLVRLIDSGADLQQKWLCIVLCGYIILWGGQIFSLLWSTSEVIYIPYEASGTAGKLLIAAVLGAVSLYCASCGIKALSRSAVIAAGIGVLSLVVIIVSAVTNARWENLTAPASPSAGSQLVRGLSLSGGMGSFAALLGDVKGEPRKTVIVYFSARSLLTVLILLPTLLLTGGIMSITEFPVVMAAQLSQPFSSQRIDSLFLLAFSVSGVFSAALQTNAAAGLLKKAFPEFRKLRNSSVIAAMILTAVLLSGRKFPWQTVFLIWLIPTAELMIRRLPQTQLRQHRTKSA